MFIELEEVACALRQRGYRAIVCATGAEAKAYVLQVADQVQSIGFGGSRTVADLGILDALKPTGKKLLRHGDPNNRPEEKLVIMREELTCDLFLLSANALTQDGRIVNIDGNGNRVAASIFGPRQVIYLVGKNKLVKGGIDDALARIKKESAPPNCARLGRRTPCATTGTCVDCTSNERICRVTAIFDKCPTHTPTTVVLIDEDLGF